MSSVSRIRAVLDRSGFFYELIFVDDASRDGTQELITSMTHVSPKANPRGRGALTPGVSRSLFHTRNLGRGRTVADGIRAAKGTVVGYMDIDCEVDPVYMPKMVSMILARKADVVIGKRLYRTSPKAIVREILSRGYQWLSDKMIGTGGLDTETGYKFFSRKKILPVLAKAKHPGWFWDTEIMVYAKRAGLMIVEEPVLFLRRFDKQSSVNIFRDTIEYVIQLWRFSQLLKSPRSPKSPR